MLQKTDTGSAIKELFTNFLIFIYLAVLLGSASSIEHVPWLEAIKLFFEKADSRKTTGRKQE